MTDTVFIRKGRYRNAIITDTTFDVIRPLAFGKKGPFITVDGTGHTGLPEKAVRIKLEDEFDIGTEEEASAAAFAVTKKKEAVAKVAERSDEDIMDDMREKFSILDDMSVACVDGTVRGLIVTGPPGIGKSFGINCIIEEAQMQKDIGRMPHNANFGVEKGAATPIGLYMMLYEYSKPGSVLVLDDSDTILYDELSLNMLKAVLDSGKTRRISWRSESRALERENVPTSFEFYGSIIFVTNLDFSTRTGKIGAHLEALMSRCHYLDMGITGMREKFLRCKQIVTDGMLTEYNFKSGEEQEILDFIYESKDNLRELSLRMVTKIADLYAMNRDKWKSYAKNTCLKGGR